MVGGTGALSENYLFANYASTIGMGAAMPIVLRLKMRFKIRDKITVVLVLLGILNYINATTLQPSVIIGSSLLIGFFKMIVAIELFLPVMAMIGNRGVFYGVFYSFILIMNQIAGYYAVEVSVFYNWQQFFVLISILCFGLAILQWIFMHDQYFALKVPLHYIDWTRQTHLKRPYLSFKVFSKSNVLHGLFMLLCLGMFMATATLQNIFAVGVLGYDQLTNAKLNLMMIPGIVAAGIVAIIWFKRDKPVKMYIFSGFAAMLGYSVIMYFSMVLEFNYDNWYLPLFLKGFGMTVLFISVWYYTLDKLELDDMMAAIGLALVWRTFLTIGFFSAVFSWFQYRFQVESLGNLAVYMDGLTVSSQSVAANLKGIQLNAIIAANKKIFGYIVIAGFGILGYILTHHFGRERFVSTRFIKVLSGKSVIARRRLLERKRLSEEIKDAAGPAM